MENTIFKKSLISDMEDQDDLNKRMPLFKAGKLEPYDISEVETILQEAETAFSKKAMKDADKAFRKVLVYAAHCDGDIKRKRQIVDLCVRRLMIARVQLGIGLTLLFSELHLEQGVCHIYAFEIQKESNVQRLISVIADRKIVHSDSPMLGVMPPENVPKKCKQGRKRKK